MQSTTVPLPADDGTLLTLHEWYPAPGVDVRSAVVVVHGMAEHAARYGHVAAALVGAGCAVYALDLRGHGPDAGDDLGHLDDGGWADIVDDILLVALRARADHPGAPVVLLGHSMGSLLARTVVLDHSGDVDALVLSGTAGDPGALGRAGIAVAAAERRVRGPRHRSTLLDTLTFGAYNAAFEPARTPFDWLSRDPVEVDTYVADPLCGSVSTTSFYRALLGALPAINDARRVAAVRSDLPVLVLAGDADPVGAQGAGPRRVAAQYREAGLTDVSLRLYPGARHEIFNETNRSEVLADLLDWLLVRFPERQRGSAVL